MLYSNFGPTIIFEKSVQLVRCVWSRPVLKGSPAISKLEFDCISSDFSKSDKEGAQGAQDTEDDNDNSNSVESDSEEDEPSASTSSPKPEPAKRMKRPNRPREWNKYNRWVRTDHTDMEMMAFIRAAIAELNMLLPPGALNHA